MRIIFMGTPEFSVPTLEALVKSEHEVIAVVTQPDKPKGRGHKMVSPPIKTVAEGFGIPVYQPLKVRNSEFIKQMEALKPDAAVVIAFGQILPRQFLSIPLYGCINIHASILPKYRGAGPIQWAVINGENETGLTTMQMDVGLDTGDMLLQERILLEQNETGGSLHDKLSLMGGPLILRTLQKAIDNTLQRIPQNDAESSHAPLLDKDMGNIDWKMDAVHIERLIRGLNPWPSAYSMLLGKMVKIWKAELYEDSEDSSLKEPGTVTCILPKAGFVVKCGKGSLMIKEIQLQGKNRMDAPSFLRGIHLKEGMHFNVDYTV